jgi:hypothetical protein
MALTFAFCRGRGTKKGENGKNGIIEGTVGSNRVKCMQGLPLHETKYGSACSINISLSCEEGKFRSVKGKIWLIYRVVGSGSGRIRNYLHVRIRVRN